MTEQNIYIDCAAAHTIARDLRGEANDARAIVQGLQNQLDNLASNWQGKGASLFAQNASSRITQLNQAASRLDEIAKAIDQTANTYQKQEIAKIRDAETTRKRFSSGGGRHDSFAK